MRYFKQAWNLIKQEKLFSSIYIIGTGLSITMVMVLSIVYYIRIANIYPETNRDRLLIIKSGLAEKEESSNSAQLSHNFIETSLMSLETAEAVTAIMESRSNFVQLPENKQQLPISVKYTDTSFWIVFPFRFIEGTPFSEADMQSGIRSAVISASLAKKLFGKTSVVGEYVNLNFDSYRISGVVKDASYATSNAFADIWVPYTVQPDYKRSWAKGLGPFSAYILSPSTRDMDAVKAEIVENVGRFNADATEDDYTFSILGQPDRQWQSIFRNWSNRDVDFNKILWQYGLIFFILLFVPAVSLSGMTDSRMERRLAEMGIRRTFGAPVSTLMNQIISENFLFTLFGGIFGLLFSYLLIFLTRSWILQIGDSFVQVPPEGTDVALSPAMLFNVPVFLIALLVCFVLNLLSALIPAWRASHRQIIYSLNAK